MKRWFWVCVVWLTLGLMGCQGCEQPKIAKVLQLPFTEDFNRQELGAMWSSDMSGRWRIKYDANKNQGRLCVEQARNNPLFLRARLPRDVEIEFDAWATERSGDVKIELFNDGRFHATGYVLIHGGWNNSTSIIDRLDEHNPNCRWKEQNHRKHCRRWKRGGPKRNRRYHWKVTRSGEFLRWTLDGKLFMQYNDPDPLAGRGHEHFAFSNWIAHVCFDNLKISEHKPAKSMTQTQPTPTPAAPAVRQALAPKPAATPRPAPSAPQPSAISRELSSQPKRATPPAVMRHKRPRIMRLQPLHRLRGVRTMRPMIRQRPRVLHLQGSPHLLKVRKRK